MVGGAWSHESDQGHMVGGGVVSSQIKTTWWEGACSHKSDEDHMVVRESLSNDEPYSHFISATFFH